MSLKTIRYKLKYTKDSMPGLDAINNKLKEVYAGQEPKHWATIVPYELGGEDPLWATKIYKSDKEPQHLHYLTLGFTNLFYDPEFAKDEVNGFGFELTFRYIPTVDEIAEPIWPMNFLGNISKYVFSSKKAFDKGHYMSANGPLCTGADTEVTAFAFCLDPELGEIETPHGSMKFLQVFGLTGQEYQDIRDKKYSVAELLDRHRLTNPLLITDLNRK